MADGTRGAFAAPLGADDNYVTDAEKAALHAHSNKAALDLVSGENTGDQVLPTWSTISGKPAVVAEGATQADARTAIGAGTSSFSGAYADLTGKPTTMTPTAHAATHAAAGSDPVTLTSAQISDLTETVQDIVGAFIVAGTNVTVTYNDAANTFTINATASGGTTDPEIVRDVIGAAMVAGSGVQITVNDAGDTITIASTAVLPTRQVIAGTGLSGGGDLSADRTLAVTYGTTAGTAAQGNDSRLSDARTPTAHTHAVTDLTATGTRDATTFLRGDNTWAVPAGGGGSSIPDPGYPVRQGGAHDQFYAPGWGIPDSWGTAVVPWQHVEWTPFYLTHARTLDALSFITTTANAGQVTPLALYTATVNWQPSELLYASAEIDVSTAAQYTLSGLALSLPAGRYMAALQPKNNLGGGVTVRRPNTNASSFVTESVGSALYGGTYRTFRQNVTYTAFTNPAPAGIKWTSAQGIGGSPFIFMRFSA